jgi:hypothetical protein
MKLPAIFRKDGSAPVSAPALPPLPPARTDGPALPPKRGSLLASSFSASSRRLLIGFDATASREPTWKQSGRLMDTLLATLPGQLQVALAVHGGGRLHTVTRYTTNSGKLRDKAAGIRCEGGYTKLVDMLSHQAAIAADVVVYIGDCFEESAPKAGKIADKLGGRGTRVIILQEGNDGRAGDVFAEIARRTGGALLPFDISSFDRVGKELLELIAVLAVEGVEAVEARQDTAPAARLLLENLDPGRLLIRRG